MYTAHEVAKYIINWCHKYNIAITNLKLQKLLYFVQGEYCRKRHERLIKNDFYAWQLGPVVPEVYYEYAMYSSSVLPKQNDTYHFNLDESELIEKILLKYAKKSTWDLVDLSHTQDPWKYNYLLFGDKSIIPYESIRKYFESSD